MQAVGGTPCPYARSGKRLSTSSRRPGPFRPSRIAGVEAFGRQALGQHDLVSVEEHMEILDLVQACFNAHAGAVHKRLGRDQHRLLTEHQLCAPVLDQDAVLGRDQEIARGTARAKGTRGDADRPQGRVARQLERGDAA